ncbi:ABC-three component system protein [Chloroflexota bacterium]
MALTIDMFAHRYDYRTSRLLTREIHDMANSNVMDQQLLELYEKSFSEEEPPASSAIEQVYNEAGVALPGMTLRRLEEVKEFHSQVIEHRRRFLAAEIERLRRVISQRDADIKTKTEDRSTLLNILKTQGALEEYTLLQKQHMDSINELNSVISSIETIRSVNTGESELKIAREVLQQKARLDYDERHLVREQAISIFTTT